jgi:AhpD family alkylhydroperoxidase
VIFDNKFRELIAAGASIGANCQPCLQFHSDKAKEYGASELEIREAINVGKTVRKGAATRFDCFIDSTLGNPCNSESSCGCGCK